MYTPILATLGYVVADGSVLMIHRNKRPDDIHFGRYNGLGGKLEPDEDVVSCLRREILEEAGLTVGAPRLRGTISWPGFGKAGEDWFGFVFLVDDWHGIPHEGNGEGTLEWVPLEGLATLPLWPSDHHFLPLVFDDDPRLFHGCMPFANGHALSWDYVRA
jgi:8-oxo-dGTP diphosphatase